MTNLTSKTPWSKETYFKEYQKSFAQGEYNLKEQIATPTGQVIRSYVSGGLVMGVFNLATFLPLAEIPSSPPAGYELSSVPLWAFVGGVVALSGGAIYFSIRRARKRQAKEGEELSQIEIEEKQARQDLALKLKPIRADIHTYAHDFYMTLRKIALRSIEGATTPKEIKNIAEEIKDLSNNQLQKTPVIRYYDEIYYGIAGQMKFLKEGVSKYYPFYASNKKEIDTAYMETLNKLASLLQYDESEIEESEITKIAQDWFKKISQLAFNRGFAEFGGDIYRIHAMFSNAAFLEKSFVSAYLENVKESILDVYTQIQSPPWNIFYSRYQSEIAKAASRAMEDFYELSKKIQNYKETLGSSPLTWDESKVDYLNEISDLSRKIDIVNEEIKVLLRSADFKTKTIELLNLIRYKLLYVIKPELDRAVTNQDLKDLFDTKESYISLNQQYEAYLQSFGKYKNSSIDAFQLSNAVRAIYLNYERLVDKIKLGSSPLTLKEAKEDIGKILTSLKEASKDFTNYTFSLGGRDNVQSIVEGMEKKLQEVDSNRWLLLLIHWWTGEGVYANLPHPYDDECYMIADTIGRWSSSESKQGEKIKEGIKIFNNLRDVLDKIEKELKKEIASSSISAPVTGTKQKLDIAPGGIDFTDIEKYLQYDGSFKGIDLSLPLLSKKELEGFDLEKEEQTLRNYLATGFNPNGDRLKRLLAGLFQKDEFTPKQLDLLRFSQELCNFLSSRGLETTPDQRAFILIADTGLFLRQGAGKAAIKPSLN